MSQYWHHDETYSVLTGFDRPMQGFFLVIYPSGDDGTKHDPLWSNLDHVPAHPETFAHFAPVLERFNLRLPPDLIERVQRDQREQRGAKHPWADLAHLPRSAGE